MAKAQADARRVINSIDWSKRDIVIWVPGTNNDQVHPAFEAATHASWTGGEASLVRLVYDATWNMRPSVATGIATLRIVLDEIRRRGGDRRVLVAGESQGAWVIGEALSDPVLGKVIDRAVLMGHPALASHHYDNDPRVVEINHPGDVVTMPINGNPGQALDGMQALYQGQVWKVGSIGAALGQNPKHGVQLLKNVVGGFLFKGFVADPHNYGPDMTRVVEFLRYGRRSDGETFEAPLAEVLPMEAVQEDEALPEAA